MGQAPTCLVSAAGNATSESGSGTDGDERGVGLGGDGGGSEDEDEDDIAGLPVVDPGVHFDLPQANHRRLLSMQRPAWVLPAVSTNSDGQEFSLLLSKLGGKHLTKSGLVHGMMLRALDLSGSRYLGLLQREAVRRLCEYRSRTAQAEVDRRLERRRSAVVRALEGPALSRAEAEKEWDDRYRERELAVLLDLVKKDESDLRKWLMKYLDHYFPADTTTCTCGRKRRRDDDEGGDGDGGSGGGGGSRRNSLGRGSPAALAR